MLHQVPWVAITTALRNEYHHFGNIVMELFAEPEGELRSVIVMEVVGRLPLISFGVPH